MVDNNDIKNRGGRPTLFSEEILIKSGEYLDSCIDKEEPIIIPTNNSEKEYVTHKRRLKVKLPSIEGLALYLDITRSTLYLWKESHPEFSDIIDKLQQKQADALINNGLSGEYAPTITKVLLTKHGYREGTDLTTNDKDLPNALILNDEQHKRVIKSEADRIGT